MPSFRLANTKWIAAIVLVLATLSGAPASGQTCGGDCDGDLTVNTAELIRGIRIALGELARSACLSFDADNDGSVSISELIAAVAISLSNCPPTPTPTITPSATSTSTPTLTPTPTLTDTPTATPTAPPLRIDIVINPDPVRPGGMLSIEIVAINPNPVDVANVTIEADVPNDVDPFFPSLASATMCAGGVNATLCEPLDRLTWNLGTLRAFQAVSVSVAPLVTSGASAPVSGTPIEVEATLLANGVQRANDAATVLVDAAPTLELTLREDVDPVAAGADLTYTLAFGNSSMNVLAPGSVLRMALPPGTTFVSASDGGMLDSGVVEWTLGLLMPGDGGARRLVVRVDPAAMAADTILAEAEIEDTNAPAPHRASARTVTNVAEDAPLQLAMEVNPDPANPGDGLAIQLTASNSGTSPLTDVAVELILPVGLANFFPSLNDAGGACPNSVSNAGLCEARERVVWQLGTLEAGSGVTVTTQPTIPGTIASGTVLTFDARASDSAGRQVADAHTLVIETGTVLELSLREDIDPAAPGSNLTYTLAFGNRTTNVLSTGAVLRMALPPGTTFVEASDGATLEEGIVEWTLGNLAPGQGGSRRLTVQLDAGAPAGSSINAAAEISDASTPRNVSRAASVTGVAAPAVLRLAMEVNPDPVDPGEVLAVQLTATNTGAVALLDVVVEVILPEGLDVFFPTLSDGGVCPNSVSNAGLCEPRERLVWEIGSLAAGAGVTVTTQPVVAAATTSGTVLTFDARATDSTGDRVAVARVVVVESDPVLELALRDDIDPAAPGTMLTYTLAFGNRTSNVLAADAVLRMPLPPGTTFESASHGGSIENGIVEWELGTVALEEGGSRELIVTVDPNAIPGAIIVGGAEIADADTPPNRTRALTVTRVAAEGSLHLAMEVNPDPADPGEVLAIQLTATNTAAVPLLDVAVEMILPEGLASFFPSLSDDGVCPNSVSNAGLCEARERLVWQLGALAAGTGVTVTVQPVVAVATASGSVLTFDAHAGDSTGQHVAVARTVVVESETVLELALREDADPAAPGDELTYTLAFGNRSSNVPAAGALLRMPLPLGATFVAASDGGILDAGVVEWQIGALGVGEGGTRQLVVDVDDAALPGDIVTAAAEISDGNVPANSARARTVTRLAVEGPLHLAMEVNPDPADPGDAVAIQLTATNTAVVPLLDVAVELILPEGLANFFPSLSADGVCPNSVSNAGLCEARERLIWELGTIAPGAGITVAVQPLVADTAPSGTVITFDARAGDSLRQQVAVARALVVETDAVLELALREDIDPVAPDAVLIYTLAFGNRSSDTVAEDAILRVPVPPGTAFVDASDGGALFEGVVEWELGTLAPGVNGTRGLTLAVDENAAAGDLITGTADIADFNTPENRSRAATLTRVAPSGALELSIEVTPSVTAPGESFEVDLTATNMGGVSLFDVLVELILPAGTESFFPIVNNGGVCPNAVSNAGLCEARERVVWDIGTLGAGISVTVTSRPPVPAAASDGTIFTFDASATSADGSFVRAEAVAAVGP